MTPLEALTQHTIQTFRQAYDREPTVVAFAPGRVNLIGDHTDYNDGFALPCALEYGTVVALAPRADNLIAAHAVDLQEEKCEFAIDGPIVPMSAGHWQNHLRGATAGLLNFGLPVGGAHLAISGNVPQGTGLSSSASLGVALGLGLTALAGEQTPDRRALAKVAQWAEHHFVGCACGLMDQIASAFGQRDSALLLDCRSLAVEPVHFPADARILIVQSGVVRELAESAYNERRAQCASAAAHFGVSALRDLDPQRLEAKRSELDDKVYRRARHVVTENVRTVDAARAIVRGDLVALGNAMRSSHHSLKHDFEVSVPAVDALVDCLNLAIGNEGGARMTGGGFGGCVVAVLPFNKMDAVKRALGAFWHAKGMRPQLGIVARPSAGACLLPI